MMKIKERTGKNSNSKQELKNLNNENNKTKREDDEEN